MIVPGSANALLLASAGAPAGYQIERSLRFNSSDSAYLSRTPASAGNRKTWTWAGWVKRSGLSRNYEELFGNEGTGSTATALFFLSDNTLYFQALSATNNPAISTTAKFTDTAAWYHIVAVADTTNATDSDRLRLYVNGLRITALNTQSYPAQNFDTFINQSGVPHYIGAFYLKTFFNGYIADVHFIDGQALDPTSFGEFDTNGIWQPKLYTGTYGTNGFKLNFADNSSNTATTLGKDTSGNGNNWTPNNLSVTAGAGNDSLVDVPTNGSQTDTGVGGEVRGNYATWNPINVITANGFLFSNGNLDVKLANATTYASISIPRLGKWYFEVTVNALFSGSGFLNGGRIGLAKIGSTTFSGVDVENGLGGTGGIYKNSSIVQSIRNAVAGDIYGIAYNADSLSLQVYRNGTTYGSSVTLDDTDYIPYLAGNGVNTSDSTSHTANFGQRPFAYTAPSGFKALCTANLPVPVVTKPSESFQTVLYTGDNTSNRTITTGLQSGFVWIKNRSSTGPTHILHDVVRGAGQTLYTSSTTAEVNNGSAYVQQFNSNNFLLGASDTASNATGNSYVAWVWNPGSSTVTNTQGSITSSVRANATAGFSIVTYTGNNTAGATIGHGLGVAPSLIIVKSRGASTFGDWSTYHQSVGNTGALFLNLTQAVNTNIAFWNNTSPTSTVFTVRTDTTVNQSGINYVAYCFAPVVGYSSFGSYTGNGSADGPFIYTGFRSRWVLIKKSSSTSSWYILDTARDLYNQSGLYLYPDLSNAEGDQRSVYPWDILSNGFKPRAASGSVINDNGATYIYAAFAENPFQYARAR